MRHPISPPSPAETPETMNRYASSDLLPCPFCGREADVDPPDACNRLWMVTCSASNGAGECTEPCPCATGTTRDEAKTRWNRRSPVRPPTETQTATPNSDYFQRNIRTVELANAVARFLGLNPADEIPFEELTRRLNILTENL